MAFLVACGGNKVTEGVIEYEVTYPYLDGSSFMVRMLPSKMTMKFKNGKFKTIVSKGKQLRTEFISDCKKKTLATAFQFGNKKMLVELNDKEIKGMLGEFPKVTYIDVQGKDTLLGFNVKKKDAVFENIVSPEAEIWYTDDIELENANWCYPYSDIKGVLVQYELERYGLRMRLKAKKFTQEEVDDKEFELPTGYDRVKLRDFEEEMKTRMGMFVSDLLPAH